jgi:hypothetical protein
MIRVRRYAAAFKAPASRRAEYTIQAREPARPRRWQSIRIDYSAPFQVRADVHPISLPDDLLGAFYAEVEQHGPSSVVVRAYNRTARPLVFRAVLHVNEACSAA